MAHRPPTSPTTQIRLASREASEQTVQGSEVSSAPHTEQARTFWAASARAWDRGVSSWSRFLSRASAARRAERGPSPGSLPSSEISRSISGPAEAANRSELRHAGDVHPGQRARGLLHHLGLHLLELAPRIG